jgi:pimeloyl-ACP methyl ester carboxylesterase
VCRKATFVPAVGARQLRRGAAKPVRRFAAAVADTPAWMKGFLDTFYNMDTLRGTLVSDQAWQASWNLAVTASATAAVACISTWTTDFRADLPKIDVPMLVIQGDADQVLPIDKTGKRLPGLINDLQLVVIGGRPARHPLDPRRPSQHRPARLRARLIPAPTPPWLAPPKEP